MMVIPPHEVQASVDDLSKYGPLQPELDVPEVLHCCCGLSPEASLLQILGCQSVQEVLFATQQSQEVEIGLGSRAHDRYRGLTKEVLARGRSISEQIEAPIY